MESSLPSREENVIQPSTKGKTFDSSPMEEHVIQPPTGEQHVNQSSTKGRTYNPASLTGKNM